MAPIVDLCALLVAWLALTTGASRQTANTVLVALRMILGTALQMIHAALKLAGIDLVPLTPIELPCDIRTVYARGNLEPELLRIPCCPKCYMQYPDDTAPAVCSWKKSPRSRACGEPLFTYRNTKNGPRRVPRCLYTSQSFSSWLTWFLSRARVDEYLHQSFAQHQNAAPRLPGARMWDIYDSPAWESLRGFLLSPYHLVFGMYVDWLNPFTNKIAGR